MTDPVMTIREIANALKLAEKTVYTMASGGDLPAFKIRGQWRMRRADFEIWLSQQAAAPQAKVTPSEASTPLVLDSDTPRSAEMSLSVTPAERAVEDLTERVTQDELHRRIVQALGSSGVRSHSPWDAKPFEMDLAPPLPQRVRVYMYNATRPPGGRPLGEHKVQLIVPGQRRGQRGSFDNGDGRIVLLVGYAAEEDVFVLWDAGLYTDFAWSRNVQVKAETIIQASAGKLATQERQLRPPSGRPIVETVLAVKPRSLAEAIVRRMELTRERLLRE
ncbi:helix-turn-helix domain-containing protein [Burkholderia gladioli]|uniref:helix-turn-helix domain-containing protein n=1 Tax=Burkholderia gladioli TaxID=28095 RepID=UPI0015615987|nr:helix-turn-helix domain-containing protein [Burkholderia gladioli]NRF88430.1 helix-turn-helix domain-containing protein [Burkholderia gladioli]